MDIRTADCDPLIQTGGEDATGTQRKDDELTIAVYKRRWYILMIFSLMSTTQGFVWSTWGPIATSAYDAFGWTDADIALLAIWGPVCYILGAPLFLWLQNSKGLRWATVLEGGLVTAGAGLRCISSTHPLVTWLANVSQILNALAGPMTMGAFANLSATWFPAHQRTTSTTILSVVKGLEFRLSFIVGPLIVPSTVNSTQSLGNRTVDEVRKDIKFLMYVTFGWCAFLFICILMYFPAKPPHPPSRAASLKKLSHIAGIKLLVRNRKFWMVAFAFILPYGTQIGWASVLDVNLSKISISQTTVGWLGFTAGTTGNICSLLVGKCSDIFSRRLKLIILLCYAVSAPFFTIFT